MSPKVCLLTGGSSGGLGCEAAIRLVKAGVKVIVTYRSQAKGDESLKEIMARGKVGADMIQIVKLDLSDMTDCKSFRERYNALFTDGTAPSLDYLVLNAGVMAIPTQTFSKDGIEMQWASNVLGHYVLVDQVFDLLLASPAARIVCLSSVAHYLAFGISFHGIKKDEGKYSSWSVYSETKLACLLLMKKLNRLFKEKNIANVIAVGAHPGYSSTHLQHGAIRLGNLFSMSAVTGSQCESVAVLDESIKANDFVGPMFLLWGRSSGGSYMKAVVNREDLQDKVWNRMEELSGVKSSI